MSVLAHWISHQETKNINININNNNNSKNKCMNRKRTHDHLKIDNSTKYVIKEEKWIHFIGDINVLKLIISSYHIYM